MAVTFRNAGALAANATTVTLNVVAPTGLANNDILVVAVLNKDNQVCTFPGAQNGISAWTKFVEVNNTTAQRATVAWARVTDGATASGSTIGVTKPTDNNLLFCGVCTAWIGSVTTGSPIDTATPTTSANASSDTVTYATFDPAAACHVVAIGVYNEDLTTAGSISGTDPTLTNRWDLESGTGTDGSIFGYSGDSSGAATGARSHSTTSTADAINIGILFGLVPQGATEFTRTTSGAAVIKSEFTKTASADAVIKGEILRTAAGSAVLQGEVLRTANGSAVLQGEALRTASADAVVGAIFERAAVGDASISAAAAVTRTAGGDAILRGEGTRTSNGNAAIQGEATRTSAVAAVVQNEFVRAAGGDASILLSDVRDASASAVVQASDSRSASGGAVVRGEVARTVDANAVLQAASLLAAAADAIVRGEGARVADAAAVVQASSTRSSSAGAAVVLEGVLACGASAVVVDLSDRYEALVEPRPGKDWGPATVAIADVPPGGQVRVWCIAGTRCDKHDVTTTTATDAVFAVIDDGQPDSLLVRNVGTEMGSCLFHSMRWHSIVR